MNGCAQLLEVSLGAACAIRSAEGSVAGDLNEGGASALTELEHSKILPSNELSSRIFLELVMICWNTVFG